MDITSGAIEGVMDVTSDGSWRNSKGATDCSALLLCLF
jgi:hypothetical protein